jgi:hypothetical protein
VEVVWLDGGGVEVVWPDGGGVDAALPTLGGRAGGGDVSAVAAIGPGRWI